MRERRYRLQSFAVLVNTNYRHRKPDLQIAKLALGGSISANCFANKTGESPK